MQTRRIFSLLVLLFILTLHPLVSSASFTANTDRTIDWTRLRISEVLTLRGSELSGYMGHRLSWKERVQFFMLKKQMRKELKKHGDKTVAEFLASSRLKPTKWWHWVLVIGLTILMIIVIINISKI